MIKARTTDLTKSWVSFVCYSQEDFSSVFNFFFFFESFKPDILEIFRKILVISLFTFRKHYSNAFRKLRVISHRHVNFLE